MYGEKYKTPDNADLHTHFHTVLWNCVTVFSCLSVWDVILCLKHQLSPVLDSSTASWPIPKDLHMYILLSTAASQARVLEKMTSCLPKNRVSLLGQPRSRCGIMLQTWVSISALQQSTMVGCDHTGYKRDLAKSCCTSTISVRQLDYTFLTVTHSP